MSFKWTNDVNELIKNRRRFLVKHGLELENCVLPSLIHEDKIVIVGEKDKGKGMSNPDTRIEAEALITNTPNLGLFIITADCFPVIYYDPEEKAVALAHLGWKPAGKGLAAQVVRRMQSEFNSKPNNIKVYIGPGIHTDSYRYDNPLQQNFPEWKPYLKPIPNTNEFSINLLGFVVNQLKEVGVNESNLEISTIDTALDLNFYSHYRSKKTGEAEGRFVTVVALK